MRGVLTSNFHNNKSVNAYEYCETIIHTRSVGERIFIIVSLTIPTVPFVVLAGALAGRILCARKAAKNSKIQILAQHYTPRENSHHTVVAHFVANLLYSVQRW